MAARDAARELKPASMAHGGGLRRKDSTEAQHYPTSPAQGCTSAEFSTVHPQCDHEVAPVSMRPSAAKYTHRS